MIILRANPESFQRSIDQIKVPIDKRASLMTKLAAALQRAVQKNFRAGGRPIPWVRSRRVSEGRGSKTLIRTAILMNSISRRHTGEEATVFTRDLRARIHEFGGVIRPRNAEALTIPIAPEAEGRKARSFKDTFLLAREGQPALIMQRVEGDKPKALYVLQKLVRMPARPFMTPPEEDLKKMDRLVLEHVTGR